MQWLFLGLSKSANGTIKVSEVNLQMPVIQIVQAENIHETVKAFTVTQNICSSLNPACFPVNVPVVR